MIRSVLFLLFIGLCSSSLTAQLSDNVIKEMAVMKASKWQTYLNLSDYRKGQLTELWFQHEKNKSDIVKKTTRISNGLKQENERFLSVLSKLLTPNELDFYKSIEDLNREEDKVYFSSLINAINEDSAFVQEYLDFQHQEVLPVLMSMRARLDSHISQTDQKKIDTIRNQVYDLYDKCLVTCLADGHEHDHEHNDSLFLDLGNLLLVEVNKSLLDEESPINELLSIVSKYEEQLHMIKDENSKKMDYWAKQSEIIKEKYILTNYSDNLNKISSRSDLVTLKHIESEAIFMLIDPSNEQRSKYFLNFGISSQL